MGDNGEFRCGDTVRVRGTPATLSVELAGRIGRVTPEILPATHEQKVIGASALGEACCVYFDELALSCWFAPHLLELVEGESARSISSVERVAGEQEAETQTGLPTRSNLIARALDRVGRFFRRLFARRE